MEWIWNWYSDSINLYIFIGDWWNRKLGSGEFCCFFLVRASVFTTRMGRRIKKFGDFFIALGVSVWFLEVAICHFLLFKVFYRDWLNLQIGQRQWSSRTFHQERTCTFTIPTQNNSHSPRRNQKSSKKKNKINEMKW